MTVHNLTSAAVDITALRPHPRNPRNGDTDAIAESLIANGQYKPIVIAADGTILAGNHTYAAALSLGWDTISAVRLDLHPDSPEATRIMVADNRTADLGSYDDSLLLALIDDLPDLSGTGYDDAAVDLLRWMEDEHNREALDGDWDKYTKTVNAPQYEPKGENPHPSDLYDHTRATTLRDEVLAADLPPDVANFLLLAAERHTVFNYRKVAEFYAHADPAVQRLMEASALVIIDLDDAIAKGYARLDATLTELEEADRDDER